MNAFNFADRIIVHGTLTKALTIWVRSSLNYVEISTSLFSDGKLTLFFFMDFFRE